MSGTKQIVIIGAGYAGMLTALRLKRRFKNEKNISITLIDKRDYQLFSFDLYEVATSDDEMTSVDDLKSAITLPINKIIKGKQINFIKSEVLGINLKNKEISLPGKKLFYDYLVLATGSASDDFGLKGAENAIPLKTFEDALRFRNRVEFAFQASNMSMTKRNLKFIIAGGGYTGCELAGEMVKLKALLAWKYNYPEDKVEILVVEAANELIPGFSKRLSADTYNRLKDLRVDVLLSSPIVEISEQYVMLNSGERLNYDAVAWAVGVKAASLNITPEVKKDRKNRMFVNDFFEVLNQHNVFALGDAAAFLDKNGRALPASAQDAIDQALYFSSVFPDIILSKKPQSYVPLKHGFILSLGGQWAIMDYNGIYLKGFIVYVIRKLAHTRYLSKVIGWTKAFMMVWFQVKIFSRND